MSFRLTTHEALSLFCAEWLEPGAHGELVWSLEDREKQEQVDILKRFFGGLRGIRVENVGANRATFYKIIMPHSARGCGKIRWLMDEQMVKLKVGVVTFNSAL